MDCLPDEVLVTLFSFSSVDELLSLSETSKRLKKLINDPYNLKDLASRYNLPLTVSNIHEAKFLAYASPTEKAIYAAKKNNFLYFQTHISLADNHGDILVKAASNNNIQVVKLLVEKNYMIINGVLEKGINPFTLWALYKLGHLNPDVYLKSKILTLNHYTEALDIAIRKGNKEIVDILMNQGVKCDKGPFSIFSAAMSDNQEILNYFIELYEKEYENMGRIWKTIYYFCDAYYIAAQIAASHGQLENLKILLGKGVTDYQKLAEVAAKYGKVEIIDYLANLSNDIRYYKLLQIATIHNQEDVILYLQSQ